MLPLFSVLLCVEVAVEEGVYSVPSAEDSSEKMVVSVSAGDLVLFESDQDENSEYYMLKFSLILLYT